MLRKLLRKEIQSEVHTRETFQETMSTLLHNEFLSKKQVRTQARNTLLLYLPLSLLLLCLVMTVTVLTQASLSLPQVKHSQRAMTDSLQATQDVVQKELSMMTRLMRETVTVQYVPGILLL